MKLFSLFMVIFISSCASLRSNCYEKEGSLGILLPSDELKFELIEVMPKPLKISSNLCWYSLPNNKITITTEGYEALFEKTELGWKLVGEWAVFIHKQKKA